jgi:adenylate cyclase
MDDANRRLAGILAADVVGYSAMVGRDEPSTLARVRTLRTDVVEQVAATHGGRLFKTTGDGFLIAFASTVQALRCAIAIQERLNSAPDGLRLRIGVHQGEVVAEGDDLLGDGVIIATRLEPLADPGGICISARVREDAVGKLALEVEDLGEPELKNIAQRHRVFRVRFDQPARPALTLPDKPSIAVLPFQNMSGDPKQEYFAEGMVDDIITALSRFKQLFVIARNSSFTYKGKSPDLRQVGRELGVRYVLEGSIRKASNRLRISGQLIDAVTGAHLWADRVEGELENVFDLQDRVTMSIVGTIVQQVDQAEIERARRRPAANLSAYDCYLRARATANPSTQDNNARALELLTRAIELDPAFPPFYGLAAALHAERRSYGWMEDTSKDSEEVVETARLAYLAGELGQGDAEVLALACNALAYVVHDLDAGAALIDRAMKINPNSWTAWRYSGEIRLWLGEPEVALEHLARAERLSPVDPSVNELWSLMAHAYFMAERYDTAALCAARVSRGLRDFPAGWRILAASAALAGHAEQARLALVRLQELTPTLRVSTLRLFLGPYRRAEDVARYQEGLRRAGLTE